MESKHFYFVPKWNPGFSSKFGLGEGYWFVSFTIVEDNEAKRNPEGHKYRYHTQSLNVEPVSGCIGLPLQSKARKQQATQPKSYDESVKRCMWRTIHFRPWYWNYAQVGIDTRDYSQGVEADSKFYYWTWYLFSAPRVPFSQKWSAVTLTVTK